MTIQQTLDLATEHHMASRLVEAAALYQQILQTDPQHPLALHLLGVIALQQGNAGLAVELISKAVTSKPDFAEAYGNLAAAYQSLGDLDQAIASLHKALSQNPDNADAHYNLGNTLKRLGRTDEAIASLRRVIAINPNHAAAHNNLGNALKELGKFDEAVASFRHALAIRPDYATAHNNLGTALSALGDLDGAEESYHKALALDPGSAELHNNIGNALKDLSKLDAAIESYRQALTINPNFAQAHNNLGNALNASGQLDAAVESYIKALAIDPDLAEAHNNKGNTFKAKGRLIEAVDSYDKAIAINPEYAEAWNNLGAVQQDMGLLEKSVASYRKALTISPGYTEAGKNLLYVLLNVPGLSTKDLFAEHLRFAETHTKGIIPATDLRNDPNPNRRLRIAYLSSDFRGHAVGSLVMPLLSSHDHERFETFCYADVSRPDGMTKQFQSASDHWRSIVGKPDWEIAAMIRADEIDVLVCLAGHFDNNRPLVCAYRAAPVQISYHDGATSGLKEMDYWLTDNILHPEDTNEYFTEALYRLPAFYQWFPIENAPSVSLLPADQAGFITFASFNNPAKINDHVIRLWAKVLKSVPGSRLLLKYKNIYAQSALKDRLAEGFADQEIEQNRIVFIASQDTLEEHLSLYAEVDIGLDPFPFNGATTTYQTLWMGVPVIALAGETFISRAAGSILHHAGLKDMMTETPEAYIACAKELATDLERLRKLRRSLRDQIAASPLCDGLANTQNVETAYRDMWQKWCDTKHPENDPTA